MENFYKNTRFHPNSSNIWQVVYVYLLNRINVAEKTSIII